MPDLAKKNKHLTLDERIEIQGCLDHGMTFKAIAARIKKDQTTVSKEVKRHLLIPEPSLRYQKQDGQPAEPPLCPKLLKSPFVCNPCEKRHRGCPFAKQFYHAKHAQKAYESLLVQAREGIPLNKESFYEMDSIISDGVNRGQHLYHIMQTNALQVSKSTVYRNLHKGYLSVCPVDFPRVVKFKPRRAKHPELIPKAIKQGRTYEDFLTFIQQNELSGWVEMDTVVGTVGGKVILTLNFTFCNFMVGVLLDNKSATEAATKIRDMKALLASNHFAFGDVFPVLLTDNGGEFANVAAFENSTLGERETHMFFCDPMQSCQKPRVEKNHTLFRDIVPHGESFDSFSQDTVNLIFSHVNSVRRKCLNGKSPYQLFAFSYSEKLADLLGITEIPANQVLQSPRLLKG